MISFKIKKLNNQGSTFVLSLLVITLLTTLALALANASLGNMMMKSMDRAAKKNFYTAESLLDEVRAGIGRDSLDYLAFSYKEVLTSLVKYDDTGEAELKDNESANEQLKEVFIESIFRNITQNNMYFDGGEKEIILNNPGQDIKDKVIYYISRHIEGNQFENEKGTVTSVGDIKAYKDSDRGHKWMIIIEDVAFSYKEQKGGEIQFSNITADIEIEYPNMTIDFVSTNKSTDFIQYTVIADDSLVIPGQTVNINASAYAGHTIDIAPSAGVGSSVIFESQSSENINVVCGGNSFSVGGVSSGTIRVGGDTSVRSEAHFKGANIWCENILTSKTVVNGTEAGATITIDSACNSYIKDDVSAEAENSDITINGNYYGYMYYGDTLGHGGSSAIIVNGKNSKVSIGASKIVLGGHAYVDIDRSNTLDGQYMTGESLSLKGSQDVYLVPAELLGVGYDKRLQNPTSEAAWNELISAAAGDANIKICDVSSYFAKQYVDGSATPYVVRKINGMVYVYWNFENTAAARSYIKDVVNGADSNLKETLIRYNNNLFNGSAGSLIQVTNPSASIQSSGLFMQWASGVPSYKEPSSDTSGAMFQIESKNYEKRYEIISHMLVTLPWGDNYISNSKVALEQLKGIVVEDSILNGEDIIEYIVDCSILEADNGQYNVDSNIIKHGDGTKNYTKVAVDNNGGSGAAYDYRVPDGSIPGTERIDGGIIIATGNVILNHDFEGLIIAGGDIRIEGNATLTTNPNTVETLILEKEDFLDESIPREPEAFKRYFYAYKSVAMEEDSREEIKIENVDYKDLVKFDNWRKYED